MNTKVKKINSMGNVSFKFQTELKGQSSISSMFNVVENEVYGELNIYQLQKKAKYTVKVIKKIFFVCLQ